MLDKIFTIPMLLDDDDQGWSGDGGGEGTDYGKHSSTGPATGN